MNIGTKKANKKFAKRCVSIINKIVALEIKSDKALVKEIKDTLTEKDILECAKSFLLRESYEIAVSSINNISDKTKDNENTSIMYR